MGPPRARVDDPTPLREAVHDGEEGVRSVLGPVRTPGKPCFTRMKEVLPYNQGNEEQRGLKLEGSILQHQSCSSPSATIWKGRLVVGILADPGEHGAQDRVGSCWADPSAGSRKGTQS